nr:AAA family ATPase [Burkholderia lata]
MQPAEPPSVRHPAARPAAVRRRSRPVRSRVTTGSRDGLLVIDTLNRAAPGTDENSSVDMGRLIEAWRRRAARSSHRQGWRHGPDGKRDGERLGAQFGNERQSRRRTRFRACGAVRRFPSWRRDECNTKRRARWRPLGSGEWRGSD